MSELRSLNLEGKYLTKSICQIRLIRPVQSAWIYIVGREVDTSHHGQTLLPPEPGNLCSDTLLSAIPPATPTIFFGLPVSGRIVIPRYKVTCIKTVLDTCDSQWGGCAAILISDLQCHSFPSLSFRARPRWSCEPHWWKFDNRVASVERQASTQSLDGATGYL